MKIAQKRSSQESPEFKNLLKDVKNIYLPKLQDTKTQKLLKFHLTIRDKTFKSRKISVSEFVKVWLKIEKKNTVLCKEKASQAVRFFAQ